MAEIDLTLNSFQVPALAEYIPPVGTKKNEGGLSTREVNDNIMMPWLKQGAIEITETSTTKGSGVHGRAPVQFNCMFVFTAGSRVQFTLDSAMNFGCTATFLNVTQNIQDISAFSSPAYEAHTVHPLSCLRLLWTGFEWVREEVIGIGMQIGMAYPYFGQIAPSWGVFADGSLLNKADYPDLYSVLGSRYAKVGDSDNTKFRVPDLRECTLVGVGQSNRSDIANHDVYTLGQFKDDQMQNVTGAFTLFGSVAAGSTPGVTGAFVAGTTAGTGSPQIVSGAGDVTVGFNNALVARAGSTTHGKQIGVNYVIKC